MQAVCRLVMVREGVISGVKKYPGLAIVLALTAMVALAAGCAEEEEEIGTEKVLLFFGDTEAIETGEPGRFGYVTPVEREVTAYEDREMLIAEVLEALFEGPAPDEEGVSAVVHDDVRVISVEIDEDNVAVVNISEEMFGEEWPGGSLTGEVFVQSVLRTVTQFPEAERVLVLVEGEYWNDGHRIWNEPLEPARLQVLPDEIAEWIDYSRQIMLAQAREYEDTLYLLATFGERPTGGYGVEITNVAEEAEQLTVTVKFTEPDPDDVVIQALTYPYDLKIIEPAVLPVWFEAEGDREHLPVLEGLDWLPPLKAGDEDIRVLSPAPGAAVARQFEVEVIELVFEGTVQYRMTDSEGSELAEGFRTGHGFHWGYIRIDLAVPEAVESGEEITVELYSISPRDGSVVNLVELDLVLE